MTTLTLEEALKKAQQLYQAQRSSEAENLVRQILQQVPDHPKALELLGLIAFDYGHAEEGNQIFQQALEAAPHDALIWCNFGHCHLRQLQLAEALHAFQQACNLKPDFAVAHNLRGVVLQELHRPQEALEAFETTLKLKPSAEVFYNLAVAYRKQDRYPEALHATAQVLQNIPAHADALNNRSLIRQELGQFSKAKEDLDQALSIAPQHGEAHFNRGCLGILTSDLPEAWSDYEWRWYTQGSPPKHYEGKPIWTGEILSKQDTIYVHADAGFGDSIQFARYLQHMSQLKAAQIYFACQPALVDLFKAQNWPVNIISLKETIPDSVTHTIPLLSLPFYHQTHLENIPEPEAYLEFPASYSKNLTLPAELEEKKLKIGITWSGSPDNSINSKRSCEFKYFAKLIQQFPDIAWISLQKDVQPDFCEPQSVENFWDVGDTLDTFSDTAQWLHSLDLIISVDTSLVHLSGALGKPTWVLLPSVPDWRWFLEREDTPWYSQTRLFRQPQRGQWKDVFWQVKKALQAELLD